MSFNSDITTNDLPAWLPLSGFVGASWLDCKALSHTMAQQWRWPGGRGSCDFHKIITCTCKHIHTSMCSFTLQHKNLLPLSWLSSGRGKKKKKNPGAIFQQSSPGQLHFHEQCVFKPEVAVGSVFLISCKHFIKAAAWQNPTESGLSAWEWQQQGGCRHVRGCLFYPSFPPLISTCLHFSSFTCSPHTSSPWPGELTCRACVFWSFCRS